MKKYVLALMMVALLLISGCTKNVPTNSNSHPAENLTKEVHTAAIRETDAPKYFIPSAVMPDGSLFGVSSSKLTFWNAKTGKIKTTGSAWSAMLSPDATTIAFSNEQGLHMLDVETGATTSVVQNPSQGDSSLALGLWSPDSSEFMYMFVREWSSDYFIFNLETRKTTAYEFKNIPNFLSSPVDWNDNGLLFVMHANKSKSGEQEYRESGYRSDLMLADMDGNFTPLTRLDDGQFAWYGGTTSNNRTMLVMIWEVGYKTSVGLLNIDDGKIDFLSVQETTVEGSISPDGQFAMLITGPEDGMFSARVFDLVSRTCILEKELSGYEPPRYFMWSEDGRSVTFGQLDDNGGSILYSVNID